MVDKKVKNVYSKAKRVKEKPAISHKKELTRNEECQNMRTRKIKEKKHEKIMKGNQKGYFLSDGFVIIW